MSISIENMRIEQARLGHEDHGIFTVLLELRQNTRGIAYGGFALDSFDPESKTRRGWERGIDVIIGIMRTVGVDDWAKLQGQYVRVRMSYNRIVAIGHIVEDRWFAMADAVGDTYPVTGTQAEVLNLLDRAAKLLK